MLSVLSGIALLVIVVIGYPIAIVQLVRELVGLFRDGRKP
jgi:hypothetical protein